MPGKKFLYSRVRMSNTSRQEQEKIDTYLNNQYQIDLTKVLKNYDSDMSMLETVKDIELSEFQEIFNNSQKSTAWDLYLHLVAGKKEAASYLSEYLRKGYGTNKDEFLADLTLLIGVKLGDQQSIELMATKSISPQILDIAKKCLLEITQHKLGVEGRQDILWDEMMSRGKAFAYFVGKLSGHSYYQTIQESGTAGIKYWSNFVEPMFYCLSEITDEVPVVGALHEQE
ncbi:hypothetical protein [Candidatus Tisiphia endosymbiont of Oplodontha viridula]|uniref:hypothetical protein n=1 Tax=Candidatus Tisiphia endosymbiont of Oplodontha viridula TaxID=3077925 RepID=UPI0035C8A395